MRVRSGWLAASLADREHFSITELNDGWRLACQARPELPLVLDCEQMEMAVLADQQAAPRSERSGFGVAIDLGTTTLAAELIALASGEVLAVETALNPQTCFGSDVMSRIRAALAGEDLTTPIRAALRSMLSALLSCRGEELQEVVIVGNTAMHHLFCGLAVESLAAAPYESPTLGEQSFTMAELGWDLAGHATVRFAGCLGGFVGSDILAGILATGMAQSEHLMALVDLGTNGEIAIGNREGIVVASTAAGPAFEAGAIRMGMRAATGAVAHVSVVDGKLQAEVIGGGAPRGICGSGLVDAVAAGLDCGAILASGRIADGSKRFPVAGGVELVQADVRELQLAKGAIAAGFRILLRQIGAEWEDLAAVHLAGAFGNYVRVASAARIGLLEAPAAMIHAAGNTALQGAKYLLAAERQSLPPVEHLSLAADAAFEEEFGTSMGFPEAPQS